MTLKAILHEEDGGYWAEVPALKGCYSQGKTIEEARLNITEAVQGYLETFEQEFLSNLKPSRNHEKQDPKLLEIVV